MLNLWILLHAKTDCFISLLCSSILQSMIIAMNLKVNFCILHLYVSFGDLGVLLHGVEASNLVAY